LMTGALTFFQPPNPDPHERARRQTQNQVNDLADSHQKELERYRQAGNAHADAENIRQLTPAEIRPREPEHVHIRLIP
jgi:hypothetical protein